MQMEASFPAPAAALLGHTCVGHVCAPATAALKEDSSVALPTTLTLAFWPAYGHLLEQARERANIASTSMPPLPLAVQHNPLRI